MNGRPSHEHYKIEAITHPSSKTKYERKEMLLKRLKLCINFSYIWLLTPGRVFGTLVIFCVTLCISCNFYQVYWDSGGCSSSNNNDNPDGRPLHGNYTIIILFPTGQLSDYARCITLSAHVQEFK